MRLVFTANGPGEAAGWVRPLLSALYERKPDLEAIVALVPDDYATGQEAPYLRELFPQATVLDPRQYVSFALGSSVDGVPDSADIVQYLGGDLMHALRLRKRFSARATTYKFAKKNAQHAFVRAFAVDDSNAGQLRDSGVPADRVQVVGNLAIDGALLSGNAPVESGAPENGVLFMPGSRPYEVENGVPFFFTVALWLRRVLPDVRVAFGIAPFTSLDAVRAAIERGGAELMWSQSGRLIEEDGIAYLTTLDRTVRFPIVRQALSAARRARMAVTIPGTKVIELAALGVPTLAVTPLNVPELVTFNGPLTYLDRLPWIGATLKRSVAVKVSRRHRYHTQPNIDADAPIVRELHGALTPGRVAKAAAAAFGDEAWLSESRERLVALYRDHVGASGRMAEALLQLGEAT